MDSKQQRQVKPGVHRFATRTLTEMLENLAFVIEVNEDRLQVLKDAGLINHRALAEQELATQRLQLASIRYALTHMQTVQ